jgi:hypothetical protein
MQRVRPKNHHRYEGATMPSKSTTYPWFLEAIRNHNSDECLEWPFYRNTAGYGIVYLGNEAQKWERVHRLAFKITYGHWPTPQGRHTCDNRACFNPRHVVEGTQADNSRDMVERGRQTPMIRPGESNPFAKLTDDAVRQIRRDYESLGCIKLAAKFGVAETTIRSVIKGTSWTHVT